MPPTLLQNSHSSFGGEQGHFEVEDQMWSARDRTINAKTKQYLEERKSLKVNIEELESLLGPDDTDVDFRRILEEARDKKGCAVFETFSSDGPSEFLVVSGTQGDKHPRRLDAPWRQNLVFFIEWTTVASGLGRAAGCVELVGKKGDRCGGRLSGKMCRYKSGH